MFTFTTNYWHIICRYFILLCCMKTKKTYVISEFLMEATMKMIVIVTCDAL